MTKAGREGFQVEAASGHTDPPAAAAAAARRRNVSSPQPSAATSCPCSSPGAADEFLVHQTIIIHLTAAHFLDPKLTSPGPADVSWTQTRL